MKDGRPDGLRSIETRPWRPERFVRDPVGFIWPVNTVDAGSTRRIPLGYLPTVVCATTFDSALSPFTLLKYYQKSSTALTVRSSIN